MMMYKIRDKKTGLYFVKVNEGINTIGQDGKTYKTSSWNDKGKVFQDESTLKSAIKKLTTVKKSKLRDDVIYPEYSIEGLDIETI